MARTPKTPPTVQLHMRGGILLLDTEAGWRMAFVAGDNVRALGQVGLDPRVYPTLMQTCAAAAAILTQYGVLNMEEEMQHDDHE